MAALPEGIKPAAFASAPRAAGSFSRPPWFLPVKRIPHVILGGGVAAGYAAREFALQGGEPGELVVVTAESQFPYERPSLSKGFLAGRESLADVAIGGAAFYRNHGIRMERGFRVRRVDFHRRVLHGPNGREIHFERLLIATGCRPRRLEVAGADLRGVFYLRSMAEARKLRVAARPGRRAVVIGAGFIGLEVASVLADAGVHVTLVFPADRVWSKLFPPPLSRYFERRLEAGKIELRRNRSVEHLVGQERVRAVRLSDGQELAADFVVAGVGAEPELDLFQTSALSINDGIVVSDLLETSVTDVWSAGDVANFPDPIFGRRRVEHWDNAAAQGRAAMRNLMGKTEPFIHVPWFFSDVFDYSCEFWGDAKGCDELIYRGHPASGKTSVWWLKDYRPRAVFSLNRPPEEGRQVARFIFQQTKLKPRILADPRRALQHACD